MKTKFDECYNTTKSLSQLKMEKNNSQKEKGLKFILIYSYLVYNDFKNCCLLYN